MLIREQRTKKSRSKKSGYAKKTATRKRTAAENPHEQTLKKWRLAEAKRQGVPAFRIFSDKVLAAILDAEPFDTDDLLAVPGIGPRMAERYGVAILQALR